MDKSMYKASTDRYLYHYTTLSSLAMILRSRCLRLFPLSKMDDLQEAKSRETKDYGRFIYISSWTAEEREIIPMWKMYCKPDSGIRIGMQENPFQVYDFANNAFRETNNHEIELENGLKPFCLVTDPTIGEYSVRNPMFETQLVDIEYSDDEKRLFPEIFQRRKLKMTIDASGLGITKNTYWMFQKEVRYRIITYIEPMEQRLACIKDDMNYEAIISEYVKLLPDYIDIHFSDKAINNMRVMTAPGFTEPNRVLLEALLEKYAPSVKIENSCLNDLVEL